MRAVIELGQSLTCHKTGKTFISAKDGHTFNYAMDNDGRVYSDEGCIEIEVERISRHDEPVVSYLSSDSRTVTTWKGHSLMRVIRASSSRTGWHGSRITHVRAVDQFGKCWYGKGGGGGMIITMRPVKRRKS